LIAQPAVSSPFPSVRAWVRFRHTAYSFGRGTIRKRSARMCKRSKTRGMSRTYRRHTWSDAGTAGTTSIWRFQTAAIREEATSCRPARAQPQSQRSSRKPGVRHRVHAENRRASWLACHHADRAPNEFVQDAACAPDAIFNTEAW